MAKENVKIFSENVDTATKSINSLRQELKELKDAMTNVDEGSEEFYKLADKAGAIQHQITGYYFIIFIITLFNIIIRNIYNTIYTELSYFVKSSKSL